jgi:hypothetical protein
MAISTPPIWHGAISELGSLNVECGMLNALKSSVVTTFVHAAPDGASKKCCMRSGNYDGSRRNCFFLRIGEQTGNGFSDPVHMGSSMYLRFVVAEIDHDSERAGRAFLLYPLLYLHAPSQTCAQGTRPGKL